MSRKKDIYLELGDIIQIQSPSNATLHEKIFLIDYLDSSRIEIIDVETLRKTTLTLDSTKKGFTDESIKSIALINRAREKGYARQHELVKGKWLNISFGGDLPVIITGKITDLEEDMIEITTYPERETIYIDFAYKGIPKDIPIQSIVIREPPVDAGEGEGEEEGKVEEQGEKQEQPAIVYTDEGLVPEDEFLEREGEEGIDVDAEDKKDTVADVDADVDAETDTSSLTLTLPIETKQIREKIKDILVEADEISFGDDVGSITQEVRVSQEKERFSIDEQVNDLLDDMLSTIPNKDRTQRVLLKLHTIVSRFKQLREYASLKNKEGDIIGASKKGSDYKPLVERLYTLNNTLNWILPVVKNKHKIYDQDTLEESDDIIQVSLSTEREQEHEIFMEMKNNNIPDGQNKYDYYIQNMSRLYSPYAMPDTSEGVFVERRVNANMDTIVNNVIENTQELYNLVIQENIVKTRRFVINRYNLGFKRLHAETIKEGFMEAHQIPLTQNESVAVDSFITLPEPYVRYSHIHLPNTNIYDKTNLNHIPLSYIRILRKATSITTKVIDETSNMQDTGEQPDNEYLKDITHIQPNRDSEIYTTTESKDDQYRTFLDLSIPKTRVLFQLIKKYIKENTSYSKIISYLEPFAIYRDDISFKQYEEIYTFILQNINAMRMNTTENEKFTALIKQLKKTMVYTKLFTLIGKYKEQIVDAYNTRDTMYSSEFYSTIMKTDNGKYYNVLLSILNDALYSDINIDDAIQETIQDINQEIQENDAEQDKNSCIRRVLAKHYTTLEDIEYDNQQPEIYFDKRYDTTHYDVLQVYEGERGNMEEPEFTQYLIRKLQEVNGLSEYDATMEAEAMILGKRAVREGQYAVLFDADTDTDTNRKYLKYTDGKWEYDISITDTIIQPNGGSGSGTGTGTENTNTVDTIQREQRIFCNVSDKCISMKDDDAPNSKCVSVDDAGLKIAKANLESVTKQLAEQYLTHNENLARELRTIEETLKEELLRVRDYQTKTFLKSNNTFYAFGYDVDTETQLVSPYARLRDLILAETDIYNRMNYILKFIRNYTRVAITENDETPHWFYCNVTNTKLLPSFYETIASGFLSGTYNETLEEICKTRGEISDDGDKWVDKHSGYTIRMIDMTTEEGYDEAGYKIQTNEILEQDMGATYKLDAEKVAGKKDEETRIQASADALMIQKVINALSHYTGIKLGDNASFIIKSVEEKLFKELPNEEVYKRKVAQAEQMGKKVASYEENKHKLLLLLSGIYFLIAIQSSVPVLKTKKTFEGCTKSFSGYPLENTADFSGLKYIVCIMKKISSSNKPWNTIKKTRVDVLEKNMIAIYDKVLSKDIEIQNRHRARMIYMEENKDLEFIPDEHKLTKWTTFLPPLIDLQGMKEHRNVTKEFRDTLQRNLERGTSSQEEIAVIKSKIIYFTFGIQKAIQHIVNDETPLLNTLNGDPFIENFCCNIQDNVDVYAYFNNKDRTIEQYNDVVKQLTSLYHNILSLSKASMVVSDTDTKLKYPSIPVDFSEETIYRAFIQYCKFNKSMPLHPSLLPFCVDNTSAFVSSDSIDEKIRTLKEEGRNYTRETLKQLLEFIHRENIVPVALDSPVYSTKQSIEALLNMFDENDSDLNPLLREKLRNVLQTFENIFDKQTEEVKDLRNFLTRANDFLQKNILTYLKKHGGMNRSEERTIVEFLTTLTKFKDITQSGILLEDDSNAVFTIDFMKNCIDQMCVEFPNSILNEVKYDNVSIPKHWGFSATHNADIVKFIAKTYQPLKGHKTATMEKILVKVQERVKDFKELSDRTPFMASYRIDGKMYRSIFNDVVTKELYTFYFLTIMDNYIQLQNTPLEEQDKEDLRPVTVSEETGLDAYAVEGEDTRTRTSRVNIEADTTLEDAYELEEGIQYDTNASIAKLLISYIKIFKAHKDKINYNQDELYDLVLRINEYEKETKRRQLKSLSVEERKVDGELRKAKLGQWGVGREGGVTKYNPDFYDKERRDMEKEALLDIKLGYATDVTGMNRDILAYEMMEELNREEQLNQEAYDLSGLPDDDDYGEQDGDEGFY